MRSPERVPLLLSNSKAPPRLTVTEEAPRRPLADNWKRPALTVTAPVKSRLVALRLRLFTPTWLIVPAPVRTAVKAFDVDWSTLRTAPGRISTTP